MNIQTMTAQEILDSGIEIRITSGEGVIGSSKTYTGRRTIRALKSRLTKERCNGDRWARAETLVSQETDSSPVVYIEVPL